MLSVGRACRSRCCCISSSDSIAVIIRNGGNRLRFQYSSSSATTTAETATQRIQKQRLDYIRTNNRNHSSISYSAWRRSRPKQKQSFSTAFGGNNNLRKHIKLWNHTNNGFVPSLSSIISDNDEKYNNKQKRDVSSSSTSSTTTTSTNDNPRNHSQAYTSRPRTRREQMILKIAGQQMKIIEQQLLLQQQQQKELFSSSSTNTTNNHATHNDGTTPPEDPVDDGKLIFDPDRQLYKDIRRKQQLRSKQQREKTAANVKRALIGNVMICTAKLGAWLSSGSSSMMSEFVHSVVDCGNQGLLLMGLRDSQNVPDRRHPYGYGKAVYFWALVSALGTFFMGAGISCTHALAELFNPSIHDVIGNEVWFVLSLSFIIDGYVLSNLILSIAREKKKTVSMYSYITNLRDPAILAILLEDGAACLGVLIAIAGISATHISGLPVFDGLAGVTISALLATMGLILVRVNHRFLLGQAVDKEIMDDIQKILLNRRSIDGIHSIQSQWTGPETFAYKAEVDFDGTFLAAKLMPRYQHEFIQIHKPLPTTEPTQGTTTENTTLSSEAAAIQKSELRLLLSWYAEDVIRTVEREVRHIEALIRKKYPGAEYIELEPMSKFADRYAIDDSQEDEDLKRSETESLFAILQSLNIPLGQDSMNSMSTSSSSPPSNNTSIDSRDGISSSLSSDINTTGSSSSKKIDNPTVHDTTTTTTTFYDDTNTNTPKTK